MNNYQKLSELYTKLDLLSFILRDFAEAKENPQTNWHIFRIESSPLVNKKSFDVSKVKYRKYILPVIEQEIQETKEQIDILTSAK